MTEHALRHKWTKLSIEICLERDCSVDVCFFKKCTKEDVGAMEHLLGEKEKSCAMAYAETGKS